MNHGSRVAAMAAASALVLSLTPAAATAAACATRTEVRGQVAALRADMRDDIASAPARSATAAAVLAIILTFHGEDADTAAEQDTLGERIRTALGLMRETENTLERRGLGALAKALQEQRERGRFTAAEREQLRDALAGLQRAVLSRADNGTERRELVADFQALRDLLSC